LIDYKQHYSMMTNISEVDSNSSSMNNENNAESIQTGTNISNYYKIIIINN